VSVIKFEPCGADAEGGKLYRLIIDGETVRENLSIDDVVRAINARDEESLGANHAPREMKEGRRNG
jgi:hypothetical protein